MHFRVSAKIQRRFFPRNQPAPLNFRTLWFYKYLQLEVQIVNLIFRDYVPATVFIVLGFAALNYQVLNAKATIERFGVVAYVMFCVSVVIMIGVAASISTVLSEMVKRSEDFLAGKKHLSAKYFSRMSHLEQRIHKQMVKASQPLYYSYGSFFKVPKDYDRKMLSSIVDYTTNFVLTFKNV